MQFETLGLAEPILRAVAAEGYAAPTPIQIKAMPPVLAGRDLIGCAQTGTGKTAAFALPILQRLSAAAGHAGHAKGGRPPIRALVICPTRELASQIAQSFAAYGRHLPLRHTAIFGGVNQHHQVRALNTGVDILIATPGRLLDLMDQGHVKLRAVEVLVLDEADRMLDMGFIDDIRQIVSVLPAQRQTLLFSATMPTDIRALADSILRQPVHVEANPVASTVQTIAQSVYFVPRQRKPALLQHLLTSRGMQRTLVFTRTKHGADRVARELDRCGIRAQAIHGNKSQNARTRALQSFKSHQPPVLVATDIASRGIDVDDISHVINYDMPVVPETYVHRIGRTARAGASGVAISFCDHDERGTLRAIERLIRRPIEVGPDLPASVAAAGAAPERRHDGEHDRSARNRGGGPRGRSSMPRGATSRPHSPRSTHAEAGTGGGGGGGYRGLQRRGRGKARPARR